MTSEPLTEPLIEPAREPARAAFTCRQCAFTSWDSTRLYYRAWLPEAPAHKALVLFHRGHEHSGRFQQFVEELALEDVAVFAWDARGHGRSPGERGHADNFACIIRDIDCFVRFLCREYGIPIEKVMVLGHSVGAVALAAWVHDDAPPIRGMVLVTPAFRVKLYVPFALPALRLRMCFGGRPSIKSYVKAKMLTHDPRQAAAYQDDPLISRNIAVNILLDLHDLSTRLLADAAAIHAPTLLLSAGSDWVVKNSAQRRFFDRLSSPVKQIEHYPGFCHALLHERDRHQPIARIRRFILERFDRPAAEHPSLLDADARGYTRREYDALQRPLAAWSPRRWGFALQRAFMRTAGRLSEGIRLGWRTGFDSGESLDYVYRNQARGTGPLGKLIDWCYLNAIGWRGIRLRHRHLQEALEAAIRALRAAGESVRIVDIASGPGRYVLETLKQHGDADATALLQDRSEDALRAGRALAEAMRIDRVTYAQGDAFSADSLRQIHPRPNIAIVSGLYELFPDNTMVGDSLRGLAAIVKPGGI